MLHIVRSARLKCSLKIEAFFLDPWGFYPHTTAGTIILDHLIPPIKMSCAKSRSLCSILMVCKHKRIILIKECGNYINASLYKKSHLADLERLFSDIDTTPLYYLVIPRTVRFPWFWRRVFESLNFKEVKFLFFFQVLHVFFQCLLYAADLKAVRCLWNLM